MDRFELGQTVRIQGQISPRHAGRVGVIVDIIREPGSRHDWDVCVVAIDPMKHQAFPAFDLTLVAKDTKQEAA